MNKISSQKSDNVDYTLQLRQQIDDLEQELASLVEKRRALEYSDDYCYTNGRMASLDKEISDVRDQLHNFYAIRDSANG